MKTPSHIRLSKDKKQLTITFDKVEYPMSSEFLRVYSPSAEVQGHGKGQEVLQLNKKNVEIEKLKGVIKTEKIDSKEVNPLLNKLGSAEIKEKKTIEQLTKRPGVSLGSLLLCSKTKQSFNKEIVGQ